MAVADSKRTKNSLTIRLTESAVFLRTDGSSGRRRNQEVRSSMLRGLLTLDLVKPTKVTSIELELQAKSSTAWPEGVGARRMEVTEEHKIFQASTIFFRAGKASSRRTASIGPGIAYAGDDEVDDHDLDVYPHTPRNYNITINGDEDHHHPFSQEPPQPRQPRAARRVSVDSSHFQRRPAEHHEEIDLIPIPPYSPFATSPNWGTPERPHLSPANSSGHNSGTDGNPAHDLGEFRASLQSSLRTHQRTTSSNLSPSGSTPSLRIVQDRSLSRRPSMDDVPENEPGPSIPRQQRSYRSTTPPRSNGTITQNHEQQSRGRKGSRFSFASVSNVLIEAVRSSSPRTGKFTRSRENSHDASHIRRGRTMETGNNVDSPGTSAVRALESKETLSTLAKVGEKLKSESESRMSGDGTYTYPISFSIPGNAPSSMRCDFGSVVWRLRATVHRPGAFKSKLTASREVLVISCPTEDDTESNENILVERHWDQQLQYLISISGRSFYIGGTVPVTFTMMPLAKVKIHRISVLIEERIDYYTQMKRIARTDPISRIELLSIKGEGKGADPILPLVSDDPEAFRHSPLYAVLSPDDDPSEVASSLMGPGPWSFHQELKLPESCGILKFTNRNRRSNIIVTHILKCVMRVERGDDLHVDAKTGKRKLFDIVVQTPVQILSCRCNPEWTSLPRYTESLDDPIPIVANCPCHLRRAAGSPSEMHSGFRSQLERMGSRYSSDSSASAAETAPVNPVLMQSLQQSETLLSTSSQFERLVSGQESELGEAPPAYDVSLRVPMLTVS